MTNNPDDPWLIGLSAAVSDGGHVDWADAEQRSAGTEQRRLVEQLRSVAAIVKAHQSVSLTVQPAETGLPETVEPVTAWRHLVLFECIGAGAFGKVYRAWDPLLDREVAVKLLAREKSGTPALDEARHLARIRHSNIVVVHGVDEDAERAGIWMEYIEGLTLSQFVRERGPMSAREASGIGLDLCSALSAIHAAGLLHLDIKAQNVMREVGGRIVLMDFSGAYAVRTGHAAPVLSGTPLYMAPELFLGGEATAASDVYSLGVLLFFLLSGRLPVDGATLEDVRAAHANRERKRLRDVRPEVPDALVQVIERATAPDLAERFRTAGELEHALASASGVQVVAAPQASAKASIFSVRRLALWAAAGVFLLAVGALTAFAWRPRAPESWAGIARFTIGPPYMTGSWPRVSPDGRLVVYGAFLEGRNRFWIHSVDTLGGRALMNTTATETPFWSPDSTTLCFFEDEKLKAVEIERGQSRVLADAPNPRGGDWSGDTILYSRKGGIFRLNVRDGMSQQLTRVDRDQGDQLHTWPEFLPDGRRFLYLIRSTSAERTGVYVGSLDGTPSWRLLPAYSRPAYAAGHILYVRDGLLLAHPVDPRTLALRGEPVTLAARVGYHSLSDAAFDVSSTGVLIYTPEGDQPSTRLVLLDSRGRHLETLTGVGWFGRPRFSPDGQRIVAEKFDTEDKNAELWLYGLTPRSETRLTRHAAPDVSPVWSPDGRRIAFSSRRRAAYDIFVKPVDAVQDERMLAASPEDEYVEDWSPDGRYLSVAVMRSGLWIMPLDSAEKPRRIRENERTLGWQSEFSPDGRWLAYMSIESGQPEVYVEPFPGDGSRWQVSPRGGSEPHWRSDSELLYLDGDSVLTSVSRDGPGWRPSTPQRLFELSVPDLTGRTDYAVSPDGRLLVLNAFVSDPLIPPIDVVLNWTRLLNR